jgi:hypothetical protein
MPAELLVLWIAVPALLAAVGLPLLGDWYDQHPAPRMEPDPDDPWPTV